MKQSDKNNKTTVLFFNLYTEMGGGEYALYNLLKEMDRAKIRPIMLFNRRGDFVDKVESLGVETVVLPFQNVMLKTLINPKRFWRLIKDSINIYRFIKKSKPEIIQCSDVLSLMMIALPVLRFRIPVVYSVIFFYEWSRMMVFNILGVLFVNKIIANSKMIRDDLIRKTILLSRRIEIIYLGVDTNLFYPRNSDAQRALHKELGVPESAKLVGMVGRFEPLKGHKYFLQAVPRILKNRSDVKFVIIGSVLFDDVFPFFEEYRNEILKEYKSLNLGESVIFLPHRNDMPEVMRSLDMFVCPSLYEGFGLVILEALASGVPVVLSRTVGALELVQDLSGVFVSEPADDESLAAAIVQTIDFIDGTNRNPLSDDGFKKTFEIVKMSKWSHYAKQLERIYLEKAI